MAPPDYPETARFLTEDERAAIIADLPEQAPTMHAKTFDLEQVKAMLKAPTFIPFTMIWTTHGVGGWGISFVLPTVIYELGISNTGIAQVMTMVRNSVVAIDPRRLTTVASIHACICHPPQPRLVHRHETSVSLDCWPGCWADTDLVLHPLNHDQEASCQVHLRRDRDCGVSVVLSYHLAGTHSSRERYHHS